MRLFTIFGAILWHRQFKIHLLLKLLNIQIVEQFNKLENDSDHRMYFLEFRASIHTRIKALIMEFLVTDKIDTRKLTLKLVQVLGDCSDSLDKTVTKMDLQVYSFVPNSNTNLLFLLICPQFTVMHHQRAGNKPWYMYITTCIICKQSVAHIFAFHVSKLNLFWVTWMVDIILTALHIQMLLNFNENWIIIERYTSIYICKKNPKKQTCKHLFYWISI